MRDVLTTIVELVGLAAVIAGVAMWSRPAAMIVGGLAVATVGYLLSLPRS